MAQITRHNRDLQRLDVSECDGVTVLSIEALVRDCPRLAFLNLSGCAAIDDLALLPFSEAKDFRPGQGLAVSLVPRLLAGFSSPTSHRQLVNA